MMQTINISMPQKLSTIITEVIKEEGYASKSEFFRTLVRLYLQLRAEPVREPFLIPFKKRPLGEIEKSLKNCGEYSPQFIKSVISGLKKSSLYQ